MTTSKTTKVSATGRPVLKRRRSSEDRLGEETWLAYIMRTSTYISNFDWGESFWKSMESTATHNLCVTGKDGAKGIAQLWLVGELQNTSLVMMDKEY